ncbi:hypothetical protein L596_000477 [Steinernema carpocapsae]|uniref:Uncharacterized protein n=1 Tax=Steinernema carpocapsae TaxID=34508 RepID=A0A4U8UKM7_STECR|nr:hypothetical protein L596_000477 [Steinernema carpocapsae]
MGIKGNQSDGSGLSRPPERGLPKALISIAFSSTLLFIVCFQHDSFKEHEEGLRENEVPDRQRPRRSFRIVDFAQSRPFRPHLQSLESNSSPIRRSRTPRRPEIWENWELWMTPWSKPCLRSLKR